MQKVLNPKNIHIADYNYDLPDERIAKFPLAERDASKLLIYNQGKVSEDVFSSLPKYLPTGALMVFNNTKVIQARLHFRKSPSVSNGVEVQGALIEVFCLEPALPNDYQLNFSQKGSVQWYCLVGNLKKWKEGKLFREIEMPNGEQVTLACERMGLHGTSHIIEFSWNGNYTWAELLDAVGELPIPPYLNRETQESDKTTYQTVYSKIKGSVAAPTAGLHFTERVLKALDEAGAVLAGEGAVHADGVEVREGRQSRRNLDALHHGQAVVLVDVHLLGFLGDSPVHVLLGVFHLMERLLRQALLSPLEGVGNLRPGRVERRHRVGIIAVHA